MSKARNHYDNLKVARNAPPEVIRAAYRSLSQKYHPDRNPGNNEAARVMAILNAAYETLADPIKRSEHDQWIAAAESDDDTEVPPTDNQNVSSEEAKPRKQATPSGTAGYRANQVFTHIVRNLFWYAILVLPLLIWVYDKPTVPVPGPKPYQEMPPPLPPPPLPPRPEIH